MICSARADAVCWVKSPSSQVAQVAWLSSKGRRGKEDNGPGRNTPSVCPDWEPGDQKGCTHFKQISLKQGKVCFMAYSNRLFFMDSNV